jgi:hypothetical protein
LTKQWQVNLKNYRDPKHRIRGGSGGSTTVFLPRVDAYASLPVVDVTTLSDRTVTTSQLAGFSSPTAPLQYNTLTINSGAGLSVDNSTYAAIFLRVNILNIIGTGFLNATGGDGGSPICASTPDGGSGGGGGGGGAAGGSSQEGGGAGGSGVNGSHGNPGDACDLPGVGGTGLGHNYTASFGWLSGGAVDGVCAGPGFGAGGTAADSELICPGCPCGGCGPIPPTYGASGGGGAGAGMIYVQANQFTGSGRLLANGGNPGLNASSNIFSFGGGGGVVDVLFGTKAAGTITVQVLGGYNAGSGNSRIRQFSGSTLTTKTFSGTW